MTFAPLSEREVQQTLRAALGNGGRVIFLGHALDQMDERDIDEQVVRQTLWRGAHDGVDMVRGNWRYRRRSGPYVIVVELQPAATAIVVTTIDTRL